ncbi:MAG TPA: lactonase family protein [Tepidisphaeraceae bacterium]|nr:lactonase family protein [Tepidisphaeraceae bacterium]
MATGFGGGGAACVQAQVPPSTQQQGAAGGGGAEADAMWCYIGTTGGRAPNQIKGIYVCKFDPGTGELTPPELAVEARAPSFVELHPSGKFLYATREASGGMGTAAYAIDRATGKLSPLNEQPSGGRGPCFVGLDATGKVLLVANYGSGHLASLPVGEDGRLGEPASIVQDQGSGPVTRRQEGPHAHSFAPDPSNRFALACDLGTDHVLVFKLDPATAKVSANDPPFANVPPGGGPRHFAFHPGGKFVYVINELANTMTTFAWDGERGALSAVQTISTLPVDWTDGGSAAEVRVHPSGKFVYGSNRGHDSIAIFSIEPASGKLTPTGHVKTGGSWPRNFNLDPTGKWLIVANERTNDLVVFKIDQETGALEPTGERAAVPSPSCVRFLK